jgi:hypothetical protein
MNNERLATLRSMADDPVALYNHVSGIEVAELLDALDTLIPVAQLYLDSFTDADRLTLVEAMRLTEVRELVAGLLPQEFPS